MVREIVFQAVGILIGGLITWWVARLYYKKAGDELRQEAGQLRRLSSMILEVLEALRSGGQFKLIRDQDGNIVAIQWVIGGKAAAGATTTGTMTRTEAPDESAGQP